MTHELVASRGDFVELIEADHFAEFEVIIAAYSRKWANGEAAPDCLYVKDQRGVCFWVIANEVQSVRRGV